MHVFLALKNLMNKANKDCVHFYNIVYFKNQSVRKVSLIVGLLIKYSFNKEKN